MIKLLLMLMRIVFEIMLFPLRMLFSLFNIRKKQEYYVDDNNWGLSEEDKRIAKEERMSYSDYIEALENDDDNLDIDN